MDGQETELPVKKKMEASRSVWLIVCNELCERFNYYGLRTVLVLYLTTILHFSDDDSTIIYHSFIFLSYFMPLFGAILADSYWGKFKTIMRLSIVYVIGNVILTGASMADNFTLTSQRGITILGLVLISIGTGGIKPCVYTFGGDQFQLPEQQDQLQSFINRFIVAIYVGSLISTFGIPELRKSVQCFGKDTCFPLAFGVPASLMFTAIIILTLGRNIYVKRKPENHVIFKTFGCIFHGLRKKFTFSNSNEAHWLDRTKFKYTEIEISDTKSALDVLYIFIAYPVFWALYEQQGSRWTLQATLMNGKIQGIDWEIKPDQIQTINPFLALILTLTLNSVLYPFIAKFNVRKPLQRIILSNCLAVLAFLFAALVQFKIFGESTAIPANESRFTVYNGFDCNVFVNSSLSDGKINISPLGMVDFKLSSMSDEDIRSLTLEFDHSCSSYIKNYKLDTTIVTYKEKSVSYFLTRSAINKEPILRRINHHDDLSKPKNGHPTLRVLVNNEVKKDDSLVLVSVSGRKSLKSYYISSFSNENFKQVTYGDYNLTRGREIISTINLIPSTIYTLLIHNNNNKMDSRLYATNKGNYLHILWQLPQYVCMIIADVIFIATTIEFSFTEAPVRIKSFISACDSLTQSIGNLVVVIISAFSFHNQVHEYLFFSGLMLANTILLHYLSHNYKYKNFKQQLDDDDGTENIGKNQNISAS